MAEERRKIFFRFRNEKIIFCAFVGIMLALYLFELLVILPKIEAADPKIHKYIHIFFGTLILINCYLSVWKFITTDATSGSRVLPSSLESGWRYCWKCEGNAPPRSRHCYQCNQCILVRDHHCVLVSHCVGHTTMRYFLSMLGNMWIALFYANLLNFDFVWEVFHSLQPKSLLTMFMPWLAWALGFTENETFLMAIFTSIGVLGFMYCSVMLAFHIRNLIKGRTTFEMHKNLGFHYDLGLAENLRQVFGTNWKYAWICPIIPSPLPGDGIMFQERKFENQDGKGL